MAMNRQQAFEQMIGERIADRFIVERSIGQGPLSSAFRARDELLQRRVTIKLFHPEHQDDIAVVESQLALATTVARLSHPNIATIIDRGEHQGMPFIVAEHVRGENLQERIDRFAPLPVSEVIAFSSSIAKALAYAHGQGVCHGNLRPANILISEDRDVKLVDFGGGSFVASLTGDPYVAPERSMGHRTSEPTPADDVYGLGVLMYMALTEEVPGVDIDISRVQIHRPDASPKLAQVIVGAVAADPRFRYASMRDVLSDMSLIPTPNNSVVEDEPGDVDAPTSSIVATPRRRPKQPQALRRERKPKSRARLLAWSMVIIPVLLLIFIGQLIAGERNQGQQTTKVAKELKGTWEFVPIVDQKSFDPLGNDYPAGENDQDLANIADNDQDTSWETEGYDTQFDESFKTGVGLWFKLDKPVAARKFIVRSDLVGWGFEVRAAKRPTGRLKNWKVVSTAEELQAEGLLTSVNVDTGFERYQYYLIWINRLSATPDKYRASISELSVRGIP